MDDLLQEDQKPRGISRRRPSLSHYLIFPRLPMNPMRRTLARFLASLPVVGGLASASKQAAAAPAKSSACKAPLLSFTLPRLQDDVPQPLCQYQGKVILAVNTASYCGFTGQYKGLEEIYAKYKDKGFVVLGFPSNDFRQEKASNKEIADFCENTFGVKFPMFAASSVRGAKANPFFKALAMAGAPQPKWNFYKYLLGRDGQLIESFGSLTDLDNKDLVKAVEKALAG